MSPEPVQRSRQGSCLRHASLGTWLARWRQRRMSRQGSSPMNWTLPGWAARDTDTAWRVSARRLAWIAGLGVLAIFALLVAYTLTLLPQAPGATQLREVQL